MMKKLFAFLVFLMLGSVQPFHGQSGLSQFSVPSAKQRSAAQAASGRSGAIQATRKVQPASSHPFGAPPLHPPVNPVAFLSATQIPAGGETQWSAVAADFNNDGKLDVAAPVKSNYNPATGVSTYSISVALNNGGGSFGPASLIANPNGAFGDEILIGDFRNSGNQDLIVVHATTPATFEIWLGNGDGTFNVGSHSLISISPSFLVGGAIFDVNADGKLDLVFVDGQSPANVWTLVGKGDGTFQAPTSVAVTGSVLSNIAFGDFNGDGILDFVASQINSSSQPQDVVFLGKAGGYSAGILLTNPDSFYDVCNNAVGDLSGDGQPEIVSANCNGLGGDGNLTVYVNNGGGSGTFKTGVYYSAGTESISGTVVNIAPVAVTIADVNGDGKNDIVSSNADGGDVTVLLGNGDGTVNVPTVGYDAGGFPRTSALVADFSGDGVPDIVVPDNEFSFVYLQGYGDGTFRAPMDFYAPVPGGYYSGGTSIASGDLNGDGYPDFVVGNYGFNPNTPSGIGITVFLSNPDGSLQPGINLGTGGSYQGVAVADFIGKGKLGIAAVNQSNNGIQIFNGNGDGTFSTGLFYPTTGIGASVIVAADLNQDGFPDLVTLNSGSQNLSVLLNDGTGKFLSAVTYGTNGHGAGIAIGDLNGDGVLDLAVSQSNQGVDVFLGNASSKGTFLSAATTTIGFSHLGRVAVSDLDGDGKFDLAVAVDDFVTPKEGLAVAQGKGDGTFQAPVFYSTTLQNLNLALPFPGDVQILDLNGDGKLDLVYSNEGYGTISVLYNTGTAPFAAGMFYDPVEYAAGSDVFALSLVDINQDGAVDVIAADNDYAGVTVLLNASGSLNTLVSSVNPAPVTKSITFTATVAASVRGVSGTPTGTVTFLNGGTSLGTSSLSSGVATLSSSSLTVGTHSITAQYSGDSNFHASTSKVLSQVVSLDPDSIALTSSLNPAGVGQPITFQATVTSTASGVTAVPTGTLTYFDGGVSLGTFSLTTSLIIPNLSLGTHSLTAQYSGDANFAAGTSPVLSQVIVGPDFSLSANQTSATVTAGSNGTYMISVTPSNGYTGTVNFTCPASLPAKVGCSFSPTSSAPTSNVYPTTTLTLTTVAAVASSAVPARPNSKQVDPTLWASLSGVGLFGMVLAFAGAGTGKKRNRRYLAILGMILALTTFALVGCGGSSNSNNTGTSGTAAGSYTVTVTGADSTGSPSHTLGITLVVQ